VTYDSTIIAHCPLLLPEGREAPVRPFEPLRLLVLDFRALSAPRSGLAYRVTLSVRKASTVLATIKKI
jgi:hypothetical protein